MYKNYINGKKSRSVALFLILLSIFCMSAVLAEPLPDVNHIFINVANDGGVKYNLDGASFWGPDNTYFIRSEGNLYELHVSNDVGQSIGQVSTTTNKSGVFYITNTAGMGYFDDIILLLAVNGTIPDDFSIRIRSSGYNWTPNSVKYQLPIGYSYVEGALDETFTKDDLIYGPQTWKPGPGNTFVPVLPLYSGQDIADTTNPFQLMFVDLKVGNLYPARFGGAALENNGAAVVEYSFHNLTTLAAFNGYGWCLASRDGQGIFWTNRIDGAGSSSFVVKGGPGDGGYSGPVYASFTAEPETGSVPCLVRFTDTSTGDGITMYRWDFGDGAISTLQNPTHLYQSAGEYTVTLEVISDAGRDTATDKITVTGGSAGPAGGVEARFSASPMSGKAPLQVQFTDSSSGATSWFWNFGDGKGSTATNPVHVYTTPGMYKVTLSVSGESGSDTASKVILVTGGSSVPEEGLSASFIASPMVGAAPLSVQFTDRSTGATAWNWDFGDGATATETNPVHMYTAAGTYKVTLSVTGGGDTDTSTRTILVTGSSGSGGSIKAQYTASPTVGRAPLEVQFTDCSNGATSCNWNFGDGTTSTESNPVHVYTVAGTYKVTLSVIGESGSDTTSGTIKVIRGSTSAGSTVKAQFTASPTIGKVPLEVQFTDCTDGATEWLWEFGDGTGSTDQNPVHLFTSRGTYKVTLTATIGTETETATKTIYVL